MDELVIFQFNVALVASGRNEVSISRAVVPLCPSTHTSLSRGSTRNCLVT